MVKYKGRYTGREQTPEERLGRARNARPMRELGSRLTDEMDAQREDTERAIARHRINRNIEEEGYFPKYQK